VLVLGGLDPSGQAGLLADIEAVRAGGGFPLGVATALTAQGKSVFRMRPIETSVLRAQLRALEELGSPRAMKLGMAPSRSILGLVRKTAEHWSIPWVVDPVVRTSRGNKLSSLGPRDYLGLAAGRVVMTPNIPEAGWLLGTAPPRNVAEAEGAAQKLLALGFGGVVVKGGHLRGPPVDILAFEGGTVRFIRRRRSKHRWRGTGCRFASALATFLARGHTLPRAVRAAHQYLGLILQDPIIAADTAPARWQETSRGLGR
jgi:hydroxymethylpyrimidine/phosphomethylpyrimidine kinase